MRTQKRPRSVVARTLVMALFAGLLSLVATAPASAAVDYTCTFEVDDAGTLVTFTGDYVGETANLRDQDGWVATVTNKTSYLDEGASGNSYVVKLNDIDQTVTCTESAPPPPPPAPTPTPPPAPPQPGDFVCAKTIVGDDVVLTFDGRRGGSENLRQDGVWIATITDDPDRTIPQGATSEFNVRLRGSGYTGPRGYAVVECVEPPCETSAILVLCEGALLGSSPDFRDAYGNPVDKVQDYRTIEAKTGRQYDLYHEFMQPKDWARISQEGFPFRDGMQELIDEGRVMFVNWKNRSGPDEWSSILAGSQDAIIDQTAAEFAAFGEPVFLTFYHEPENNIKPAANGDMAREFQLVADYGQTFRYIHDRFDAAGADNVIWVWDVMGFSRYYPYYEAGLYPGDDVIDWVAYNQYNWYSCHGTDKWTTFEGAMAPFYNWLDEGDPNRPSIDKPIMIGEFSTEENQGAINSNQTKGDWYRSIPSTLQESFPRIKALTVFDTEGRRADGSVQFCQWSVESSDDALAGWIQAVNDPYLNQFQD